MPTPHCKPCLAAGLFALAMFVLATFVLAMFVLVTCVLVTPLSLPAAAQNPPAPAGTSNAQSQDQSVETLKVNVR